MREYIEPQPPNANETRPSFNHVLENHVHIEVSVMTTKELNM